jgi:trimeric autotransporter adhesin
MSCHSATLRFTVLLFLTFSLLPTLLAQTSTSNAVVIPNVIRISGVLTDGSGTFGATFSLYKDQEGGSPLWLETQTVAADASGHYSALLGFTKTDGIPLDIFASGEARWLGVKPEGKAELPRVLLVSVPYALKAGDAQTLEGLPASAFLQSKTYAIAMSNSATEALTPAPNALDTGASAGTTNKVAKWTNSTTLGDSTIYDSGTNVGIGTTSPQATLDVNGTAIFRSSATTFSTTNSFGPQFSFTNNATPTGASWRFGVPGYANATSFFIYDYVSQNTPFTMERGAGANSLYFMSGGKVGMGTNSPTSKLTVVGTIQSTTGGFKFPDSTIQTTAATGTITGVTAGNGLSGGGTSGNVNLAADFTAVQARVTGTCSSGTAVGSVAANGTVSCNTVSGGGGSLTLPFSGTGADTPPSVQGVFLVADTTNGPANTQNGAPDPNSIPSAIIGVATGTGIAAGVVGKATGAAGVPIVGLSTSTTGGDTPVIVAWSQATSGSLSLINGMASSPGAKGIELDFAVTPAGVISASVGGNTQIFQVDGNGNINNSGQIMASGNIQSNAQINAIGNIHSNANISANGTISAQTKNFKIDDPLDPARRWLYHTSIESPDMKNLYDGVVVLDKRGEAWIAMPEWFEALNRDFRYQLTAIGAPGPRLFVAKEISGNRFKIAGGKPGMKVSWLVTGIRHDAWAADNRTPVVQDKVGIEVGNYYHQRTITPDNAAAANAKLK